MASFFKSFGKGILYLITLPIVLVVLCIGAVVCFFIFLFMGIKELILFVTGRKLFEELPEDKKAREIIQRKVDGITSDQPSQQQYQQPQQPNTITINIPVDTFKQQYQQNKSPIEIMEEERKAQEIQYQQTQEIEIQSTQMTQNNIEEIKEPVIEEPIVEEIKEPVQEETNDSFKEPEIMSQKQVEEKPRQFFTPKLEEYEEIDCDGGTDITYDD